MILAACGVSDLIGRLLPRVPQRAAAPLEMALAPLMAVILLSAMKLEGRSFRDLESFKVSQPWLKTIEQE